MGCEVAEILHKAKNLRRRDGLGWDDRSGLLHLHLEGQSKQLAIANLDKTRVHTRLTSGQLNLDDFATHLHDALLLTEPVVVRHQLGEVGVLQFPLGPNPGLAGNTSRNLEHPHRWSAPTKGYRETLNVKKLSLVSVL